MASQVDASASTSSCDSQSERAEAEAAYHAESRKRAARVVAARAADVAEFRILAGMLGLEPADLAAARHGSARRRAA
jgi:hypothetical protein